MKDMAKAQADAIAKAMEEQRKAQERELEFQKSELEHQNYIKQRELEEERENFERERKELERKKLDRSQTDIMVIDGNWGLYCTDEEYKAYYYYKRTHDVCTINDLYDFMKTPEWKAAYPKVCQEIEEMKQEIFGEDERKKEQHRIENARLERKYRIRNTLIGIGIAIAAVLVIITILMGAEHFYD